MYKKDKVIRRYSEPFKLKSLDKLTTGKLNKYQLGKAYVAFPKNVAYPFLGKAIKGIGYNAKRATKNAINLYNEIRLHLSLDFKTPNMVYLKTA